MGELGIESGKGNRKGGISGKRKGMSSAEGDNVPVLGSAAKLRWLCPYRRVGCFPNIPFVGSISNVVCHKPSQFRSY